MKVLVGCEFSGIVRDAFAAKGHDAWSCDLLDTRVSGNHIKGDLLNVLGDGWDLAIFHPPCTYLCSSGLHWNKRKSERQKQTEQAIDFVRRLLDAPIEKMALENPIGCISTRIRKPDQIIQPFQFGHPESKSTCLWLKNLPLLKPTNVLKIPDCGYWNNQTPSRQNKLGPSEDRWKERSVTYAGIAQACADQWG